MQNRSYGTHNTDTTIQTIASNFIQKQQTCRDHPSDNACVVTDDNGNDIRVHLDPHTQIVPVRITAMTLPWGGLHDIGPAPDCRTGHPNHPCDFWDTPHKTHDDGKQADLGFSTLDAADG
ncbi:MAG: hypothetical protein WA631_00005, partial [Nitrososphaeraceae archaeon]